MDAIDDEIDTDVFDRIAILIRSGGCDAMLGIDTVGGMLGLKTEVGNSCHMPQRQSARIAI